MSLFISSIDFYSGVLNLSGYAPIASLKWGNARAGPISLTILNDYISGCDSALSAVVAVQRESGEFAILGDNSFEPFLLGESYFGILSYY